MLLPPIIPIHILEGSSSLLVSFLMETCMLLNLLLGVVTMFRGCVFLYVSIWPPKVTKFGV